MKIYNYTGRDINIYDRNDCIIRRDKLYTKSDFVTPREVIKACDFLTPQVYSEVGEMTFGALRLPVQQFYDADAIEDFCPDFNFKTDLLIAPNIYIQVVRTHNIVPAYTQLATIYSLVHNNSGRTVGCLGLELK